MRTAHCLLLLLFLALTTAPVAATTPWRRAYVVDARLAALRAEPNLSATVRKRLGTGRALAVVERRRSRDGYAWVRVAVTRRTRGWLLADAIASPGDGDGERRIDGLLVRTEGVARLRLARLAVDHFPRLRAPATAALAEEAEAAAALLTQGVARRLGPLTDASPAAVRALMLSDPLLDRYNRLGVTFDVDVERRTYLPRAGRRRAAGESGP